MRRRHSPQAKENQQLVHMRRRHSPQAEENQLLVHMQLPCSNANGERLRSRFS
jgi:hypothetical protein